MQRITGALAEAGYAVTLVGRKKRNSVKLEIDQIDIHRFKCFFNSGALFYMEINIRIFWHVLFNKMDAVCAVDLDTIAGVTSAARFKNIPVVFDAHEWFTEVPELIGRNRVRNVWKKIETIFVPKSTARYTVNDSLAQIFSKQFNIPFDVVRNVPAVSNYAPPKMPEHSDAHTAVTRELQKVILYQGALNKGRGIEASILAMKQLDEFELWLVGEGDLSQFLRAMVDQENLSDRVKFLGYKTPNELKAITASAYLGLNLLEGESQNYYYSLANKFFDYMQAGVPSLNMRFPEYERILSDYPCGCMIDMCEPMAISSIVLELAKDEKQYKDMVQSSIEARIIFNWDIEKEHLIEIWKRVF